MAAILSEKIRVSYTSVLVLIGLLLSYLKVAGRFSEIPLDRSLVLGLVVPPLIFEAAMRTRFEIFHTVRRTVLALAIFGVIFSALSSGFILTVALGLPLVVALTFGVIVSPTDPVSVVNLLKRLKAPDRLTTLLESEAYLNDATAVVLYPIALSLTFRPLQDVGLFAYTFGGGVLVGVLVSGVAELLYRLVTEPFAETSFTIAVIFGSYAFAESLGASGLVAVAIAGLYMGNRTMRIAMSEKTRTTMTQFWEVGAFMVTSFAFLLLGLRADISLLIAYSPFIIAAFLAVLLARIVSVYPVMGLSHVMGERIGHSYVKVVAMSGLRGVISVALALSLPEGFPFREQIIAMTFGVALLSLVVQGELLQFYLRKHKF